jgi:hypothetical protein
MKKRPTTSWLLPNPLGLIELDSSSSRAFSIPPQARTKTRARTRPALPSSVRMRASETAFVASFVTNSIRLACSRT